MNVSRNIIPNLWHYGLSIAPWYGLLFWQSLFLVSKVFMSVHNDMKTEVVLVGFIT